VVVPNSQSTFPVVSIAVAFLGGRAVNYILCFSNYTFCSECFVLEVQSVSWTMKHTQILASEPQGKRRTAIHYKVEG